MAKIVETMTLADEVSGIYVFDDGTRLYWTEGRSSTAVAELPDGQVVRISVGRPADEWAQYVEADEDGDVGIVRTATPAEEAKWVEVRKSVGARAMHR